MFPRGSSKPALYPNHYTWLILIATLDIMMTTAVIYIHIGGYEANLLAKAIILRFGVPGMAIFKFAAITLVICICEFVGRKNFSAGRLLALIAIALNCIPVMVAFALLKSRL